MVLDTCGRVERQQLYLTSDRDGTTYHVLRNEPQFGFFDSYSLPSTKNGTKFAWGDSQTSPTQVITASGGLYRMCWCASGYACGIPEDFQTDAGVHNVIGPFMLLPDPTGEKTGAERVQHFICTSNEPCAITGLQGKWLQNGDQLMIKKDCRPEWIYNTSVSFWPSRTYIWGVSDLAKMSVMVDDVSYQSYAWGLDGTTSFREVRSEGAYYRMCWCAKGFQCDERQDFVVDAGTMQLNGPHFDQNRTCFSGTVCEIRGITGVGLSDGDRTMVLSFCDTDVYIARSHLYLGRLPWLWAAGR
jgi:hypothetical protein